MFNEQSNTKNRSYESNSHRLLKDYPISAWMITLHKKYVKLFIEGKKNIELRTRVPKKLTAGDILIVALAGSHNKVIFWMEVSSVIKLPPDEMFRRYNQCTQLDYKTFFNYTHGREYVYGIICDNITCFDKELYTTDFDIKKAPQWFSHIY